MSLKRILSFSGPIGVSVKICVQPKRREEFLRVILADAAQTLKMEPDSLQFTVGEDIEIPNQFYFHEQYKSMQDFEYHKTTSHFMEWKDFCGTDPFITNPVVHIFQCNHEPVDVPQRHPAFCLNVELCIKPNVRDEFLNAMVDNQVGARTTESKCMQFDFGESVDNPNSFYLHEQYTDKEGFEAHTKSPHFLAWQEFIATKEPFTIPHVKSVYQTVE
eukprot:CAMPEP_0198140076 /NCGR_PEP_ID=MMETSP1443-20131203/3287_1 /TAXON_ID=186043 /ORGANISM="Entomoneis sp., Strain CCMP2396" /LENGTH=216 /DNA_ID=CAMNT_0043802393 /DNA_START=62 /DNA_END=712 /DNA_ORIENTATION=+